MGRLLRMVAVMFVAFATGSTPGAQGDATVHVVGYVDAAPASRDQAAALLKELADAGRRDGAMRFEVLQRTTESNQYLLLGVWKDQQTLDRHAASAETKRIRERLAPLLLSPIDERLCVTTIAAPLDNRRAGFYVVTHIDVPGTNRDAALRLMQALVDRSRQEPGNLRFDIVHQRDRTNHFTAIEAWADQKSDDGHEVAPHTRTFRGGITPLLGALYDQRRYKPM